jgi:hypothetical protein
MSIATAKVERKFLPNEIVFQTRVTSYDGKACRFPKILAMYVPNHHINEIGTPVFEWNVPNVADLKLTAKMYYQRYDIATK